jgi:hypothetical protein
VAHEAILFTPFSRVLQLIHQIAEPQLVATTEFAKLQTQRLTPDFQRLTSPLVIPNMRLDLLARRV